jgi:DNA end-binding protein Ku
MRSIWSGAISFGLVFIPVRIYPAAENNGLRFHLLRRSDHCRIRHVRVCETTGEEVPYEEIVRGYEYEDGEYVVFEEADFKRANPRKTQLIEIMHFVAPQEIEPRYLEKPYYLEPETQSQKVYALLREALRQSGKAGIGRFVLSSREHLVMLSAEADLIMLNLLRFPAEFRPQSELAAPASDEVNQEELDVAIQLIDTMSEPWQPEQYRDAYVEDVQRLVQLKLQGREMELSQTGVELELDEGANASSLFNRLRQSLDQAQDRSQR